MEWYVKFKRINQSCPFLKISQSICQPTFLSSRNWEKKHKKGKIYALKPQSISLNSSWNQTKSKLSRKWTSWFSSNRWWLLANKKAWTVWSKTQKCPPSLVFFFKYLQNKKRYDFDLLWLLVITYSERFYLVSHENCDRLRSYCDFVRGVPKNSKKHFFSIFFVLKQLFLQNI